MVVRILAAAATLALAMVAAGGTQAEESEPGTVRLWSGNAPGEQGPVAADEATPERVTNVKEPSLTIFPAPKEKATGVGIILAPGGGYRFLSWTLEGTEIAHWFNNIGVTAFVLKYRIPTRSFDAEQKLPLMDAERAVSLVRSRASEWGLDPAKIGFLGFSAGGHLAANLANNYGTRAYEAADDIDKVSCRPDFSILIYPGGLVDGNNPTQLQAKMKPGPQTPPTFLAVAVDDKACSDSSMAYFQAMRTANIPGELHIYAGGGHGFGIRPRAGITATWTDRSADWMRTMKILPPSGK